MDFTATKEGDNILISKGIILTNAEAEKRLNYLEEKKINLIREIDEINIEIDELTKVVVKSEINIRPLIHRVD